MRILLISHGFPPRDLGGTEIHTRDLAHALRDDFGHEVAVLTRESDPTADELRLQAEDRDGIAVYSVNNTFSAFSSFSETYRAPRIADVAETVVDGFRPQVAHFQHVTCLSTELVSRLRLRGVPTVLTLNDYWFLCHRGQLFDVDHRLCPGPHAGCGRCILPHAGLGESGFRAGRWLRSLERVLPGFASPGLARAGRTAAGRLGRLATAHREGERRRYHMLRTLGQVGLLLAPSETLRGRFVDFGVPDDRLHRVRQGLDHRPLVAGHREPSGAAVRFGFLGSLIVSKAPHVLLQAFQGLDPSRARLEVFGGIAGYHGDDSYRSVVEPLLDQPGVTVHGPVPHERIAEAFAAIDVLVIPSTWIENAPFVIREAFTAGVPVVASDLGGMAEMVDHEVSGLLFEPGDPTSLRAVLERFLDEKDLIDRLRAGLPDSPTIADHASELLTLYGSLSPPATATRIVAVVLNYRTPHETVLAVRSLERGTRTPDELIVVDNGAGDDSLEVFSRLLPGRRILPLDHNRGFSGGVNAGIRTALAMGADAVLIANSDVMLGHDCLHTLQSALEQDRTVGLVSPLILDRRHPGRITSAGLRFGRLTGRMRHLLHGTALRPGEPILNQRPPAVMACSPLVRSEVFEAIGGFDEDYFFSFEDLDFCLRAGAAGYASQVAADARAYHGGSLSIGPGSELRLYYATRNHLLAVDRAAPLPWPLNWTRRSLVAAFNLLHAARWRPRSRALAAWGRGLLDHARNRLGAAP